MLSVLLHGLTAAPLAARFGADRGRPGRHRGCRGVRVPALPLGDPSAPGHDARWDRRGLALEPGRRVVLALDLVEVGPPLARRAGRDRRPLRAALRPVPCRLGGAPDQCASASIALSAAM